MKLNVKISAMHSKNIISGVRELLPQLKITEKRYVLINTIWITLAFAVLLALLQIKVF